MKGRGRATLWLLALLLAPYPTSAQSVAAAGAGAAPQPAESEPEAQKLPADSVPKIRVELAPKTPIAVGDLVKLTISADAREGDDVTIPEQSFAPFEVHSKRARVTPAQDGRQRFVFELELLAFEPGRRELEGVELRVVTKAGIVGAVDTDRLAIEVRSLIANEPNAKLKPETQPVAVMQDDYTLLYIAGGLAAAALIALITWLTARYLARRVRPAPPPPPPRPPWEIAAMKLADLRRRKPRMIEEGRAAQFVDEVSDVVREYLGGRFGFDGLETTTDEMLMLLRARQCNTGLWQEIAAYLGRCDLVKFAKVEPDQDEADLVFAKAQDIVQFSMPLAEAQAASPPRPGPSVRPEPPAAGSGDGRGP